MTVLKTQKCVNDVQDVHFRVLETSKIIKKHWKTVYFLKCGFFDFDPFWTCILEHLATIWELLGDFLGLSETVPGCFSGASWANLCILGSTCFEPS